MTADVVAFRLERKDLEYLREHGVQPAEEAKRLLEGRLRAMRFRESADALPRIYPPGTFDVVGAIRKGRDELDRRR